MMRITVTVCVRSVLLALLAPFCPAQDRSLSAEFIRDLLASFVSRVSGEVDIHYKVTYHFSGSRHPSPEWLIIGSVGDWSSRRERRTTDGVLRSVRIERNGRIYSCALTPVGWDASVSKRGHLTKLDSLCPLQRYLGTLNGKPWRVASFEHTPIGGWIRKKGEKNYWVIRMPMTASFATLIEKGAVIRGFLGWDVWLERNPTGDLRLRKVVGLGSKLVSDVNGEKGALVPNPRSLGSETGQGKFGVVDCVAVRVIEFSGFVDHKEFEIPTEMTTADADGKRKFTIDGAGIRPASKSENAAHLFKFESPAQFGLVGRLSNMERKSIQYFGEAPGLENKVMGELISNGVELYERHAQSRESRWPRFVIALLCGLGAGGLLVFLFRRRRGAHAGRQGRLWTAGADSEGVGGRLPG